MDNRMTSLVGRRELKLLEKAENLPLFKVQPWTRIFRTAVMMSTIATDYRYESRTDLLSCFIASTKSLFLTKDRQK